MPRFCVSSTVLFAGSWLERGARGERAALRLARQDPQLPEAAHVVERGQRTQAKDPGDEMQTLFLSGVRA